MDKLIQQAIDNEYLRQQQHIELIASENFVSKEVLDAQEKVYKIS